MKKKKEKNLFEKIDNAKGEVTIKAYKDEKLVYYDSGQNAVTNWMRQIILMLLTGNGFSSKGENTAFKNNIQHTPDNCRNSSVNISKPDRSNHSTTFNYDGYLMNNNQYFWDPLELKKFYTTSEMSENIYAWFPTKILFGTGREFNSWEELKALTETNYNSWYSQMLQLYGESEQSSIKAANNFNSNIQLPCNQYSGSLAQGISQGEGNIILCRTTNDPDPNISVQSTETGLNMNYGIVGAIKSPYFDEQDNQSTLNILEQFISEQGRLLQKEWRGVGRPAFIYFRTPTQSNDPELPTEAWDQVQGGIDVTLSRGAENPFLHKITFSVKLPQQTGTSYATKYYPYNGYNLKQIGLFNDSLFVYSPVGSGNQFAKYNMSHGTLLAKKNITPFFKTADLSINLTWVLSI